MKVSSSPTSTHSRAQLRSSAGRVQDVRSCEAGGEGREATRRRQVLGRNRAKESRFRR